MHNTVKKVVLKIMNGMFLFRSETGVLPVLWISEDYNHFIVPAGDNHYMRHKQIEDFVAEGLPDVHTAVATASSVAWIEYDISRLPSVKACEFQISMLSRNI